MLCQRIGNVLVALVVAGMVVGCAGESEKEAAAPADPSRPSGWLEPVRGCAKECAESYSGGPATLFCIDSCDATVEAEIMDPVVGGLIGCLKGCVVRSPGDEGAISTCLDTCESG
jgi:hypothetical protein